LLRNTLEIVLLTYLRTYLELLTVKEELTAESSWGYCGAVICAGELAENSLSVRQANFYMILELTGSQCMH